MVISGASPHPTQSSPSKSPVTNNKACAHPHHISCWLLQKIGWAGDPSAPILLIRIWGSKSPSCKSQGWRKAPLYPDSITSHHIASGPLPFPHNRVGCQQGAGWCNWLPVAIAARIQDADSPQTPRRQDPRWIHPVSRTARVIGQAASSSQTCQVLDFI